MKQVLAYSTISQLGYVVMAVGIGASNMGLLHFVTHAFGKACLFLCVGTVSRFVDQQGEAYNMQHMGGLHKILPAAFYVYVIASLSLAGMPALAGSLSKEAILAYALAWASHQAQQGSYFGSLVPLLGFCTTLLTVVYIGRQCYLIFMGTPRESYQPTSYATYRTPWLMKISMFALGMGTLSFWYGPLGDLRKSWLLQRLERIPLLAPTLPITETLQHWVALLSSMALLLGVIFLIVWEIRSPTTFLFSRTKLFLGKQAWDQLNNAIAQGVLYLSQLIGRFDTWVANDWMHAIGMRYVMAGNILSWLDRTLLDRTVLFIASLPQYLGKAHQTTQRGNLQSYLLWTFIGIGLLLGGICWATHNIYHSR